MRGPRYLPYASSRPTLNQAGRAAQISRAYQFHHLCLIIARLAKCGMGVNLAPKSDRARSKTFTFRTGQYEGSISSCFQWFSKPATATLVDQSDSGTFSLSPIGSSRK
jgi:hypothetical protein